MSNLSMEVPFLDIAGFYSEGSEDWPPVWTGLVLEPVESKTEHVSRPIHVRSHILAYLIGLIHDMHHHCENKKT